MLSKEEIENVEHAIKNFNGKLVDCVAIGKMLTEYKQLEADKQKLIEKLEEDIENYHITRQEIAERNNYKLLKDNVDTTTYNLYRYFITELKKILKILKGEKE